MAENSKIEWTDHTFNPWMGCTKVSPACQHCYAERDMDHHYKKVRWGPSGSRVMTSDANWRKPLKWKRDAQTNGNRARVFCASLADVFEDWQLEMRDSKNRVIHQCRAGHEIYLDTLYAYGVECQSGCNRSALPLTMDDVRLRLFRLIDATPFLDWLLLTKRAANVLAMWPDKIHRDNVWLGTSIEDQFWADQRLPYLHEAKRRRLVAKTFVSAEPMVGPITLQWAARGHEYTCTAYNHLGDGDIDWVIAGGESGPHARPCDPEWFRSLRDQCQVAGTAFFFKQWGEFNENQERVGKNVAGRLLDGTTHDDVPASAGCQK